MKKFLNYIFLLAFFLGNSLSEMCAQERTSSYTDYYDLAFTNRKGESTISNWTVNPAYLYNMFLSLDAQSNVISNNAQRANGLPYYSQLRWEQEQRILLPSGAAKASVSLQGMGTDIDKVSLCVDALDDTERIVASETVLANPKGEFESPAIHISVKGASFLNVKINIEGHPQASASMKLSQLNISLDEKPINEYPLRTLPSLDSEGFRAKGLRPTSLASGTYLKSIPSNITNRRIIGLGESVHGSVAVAKLSYDIILEAIQDYGYRLVLLEMPLEVSLMINRYILDEKFELDNSVHIKKEMLDFLNRIRAFNKGKPDKDKVRLFGVDYVSSSSLSSMTSLFDFLAWVNRDFKNEALDRLSLMVINERLSEAVEFVKSYRTALGYVLTADEVDIIHHILTLNLQMGRDPVARYNSRDSVMYLNTNFLLNQGATTNSPKTIIYGHAIHINSVSTYPANIAKPLGGYLKDKYGDEYVPVGILIGAGTRSAMGGVFNIYTKELSQPPLGSLESALGRSASDVQFLPLREVGTLLVMSRFGGAYHTYQEFYPMNMSERFDGILFIKDAKEGSSNNVVESQEHLFNRLEATSNVRKSRIEEISKRVSTLKL